MLTEHEALKFDGASCLFEIVKSLVVIEETSIFILMETSPYL